MLILGRGTDLETTSGPQSLPSMCENGESSLASVISVGVLEASWLPGQPKRCAGKGKALPDLVKFKLLSSGPLDFPIQGLW